MERLSVTTAIIGLLAVGNQVTDMLWNLNTAPKGETSAVDLAIQEVKQFRSSVQVLYKTLSLLESGKLPFPERGDWIEVDYLIAILTDTVLAMSELEMLCETIEQNQTNDDPEVVILGAFKGKMNSLTSRIRWHNLSTTMVMTILKW